MSNQFLGIEPARKSLGDLVDAAQRGTDTILTRNGRPVARLTAYQTADTMTQVDLTETAAAVITRARTNSGLTAPAFDFEISRYWDQSMNGIGGLESPLGAATYEIANEGQDGTSDEREARARLLWEALQLELTTYAAKCRSRNYSGWSSAARSRGQRIAYAD